MKRRVNVRGIIINDKGEIFAQRLTARDKDGQDFWSTPGGGLDSAESLHDGLKREMIEETGVAPEIGDLLFVQQFAEAKTEVNQNPKEFLEFFFLIKNWQDYENIDLKSASHGVKEISKCGFVNPRELKVLPDFLSQIEMAELFKNPATRFFNYL